MQTKVKDTEMHTNSYGNKVRVTRGILKLDNVIPAQYRNQLFSESTAIIYSKTEKAEKGDLSIWPGNKVLVTPNGFSAKHIRAIKDGKLKEGEEVLVLCTTISTEMKCHRDYMIVDFPETLICPDCGKQHYNITQGIDVSKCHTVVDLNIYDNATIYKIDDYYFKVSDVYDFLQRNLMQNPTVVIKFRRQMEKELIQYTYIK